MARLMRIRAQRGLQKPIVEWKYVLFRWNDRPAHVKQAKVLASAAGVDLLAFYPGLAPLHQRSWRYPWHPCFRALRERTADAVIVNFSRIPPQLLSP